MKLDKKSLLIGFFVAAVLALFVSAATSSGPVGKYALSSAQGKNGEPLTFVLDTSTGIIKYQLMGNVANGIGMTPDNVKSMMQGAIEK